MKRIYLSSTYYIVFLFCPLFLFGQFRADFRGTNDDTDGGTLQLATPSENHFLRLFGGTNNDTRPYIYFNNTDTFRIANGLGDFSNFKERLTISPNGFVGINTDKPQSIFHAHGDITTPWGLEFNHYEPLWGVFSKQTYLSKSWNSTLWDYLYLGATGSRNNNEQPAMILSNQDGVLFGKGHDDADQLSVTHVQIDTAGRVGIGVVAPSTSLEVNGFTMLGSDAPQIKMKKLVDTMAIGSGNFVSIAHGISGKTKILGVHIFVDRGLGNDIPPSLNDSSTGGNFHYNFSVSETTIDIANRTGPIDMIGGRPLRVLIIYED